MEEDHPRLEVVATHWGILPQWASPERLWASRQYELLVRDGGGSWRELGVVPAPAWRRACARVPLLNQALRLGVHGMVRLASGGLVVCTSGMLLRAEREDAPFERVMAFEGFRKPARQGLTRDRKGRVYLAQYALNHARSLAMHLWRSDDDGRHFQVVHRFAPASVRHIHFVQEDPVDGALWMGTGDADAESAIFRSDDGGATWDRVGGGSQEWRAIGLAFRPEAIYFGTDAGSDAGRYTNRILRLDRASGALEELGPLQGPVHAATTTRDGDVLLSTGVEGGENETDGRVHLWHSADGARWREIASWESARQPRRVQYAVAHFVEGQPDCSTVYVALRGVRGLSLGFIEARLSRDGSSDRPVRGRERPVLGQRTA